MITFDNDAADTLVRCKVDGEFTRRIVEQFRSTMHGSQYSGKAALIDLTGATAMFWEEDLKELARSEPLFGDIALLSTPRSGSYGLCRIFQAYGSGSRKIGCFDNAAHAEMWLEGATKVRVSQADAAAEQYQLLRPIVWYVSRCGESEMHILAAGTLVRVTGSETARAGMIECEADGTIGFVFVNDLRSHGAPIAFVSAPMI